MANLSKKTVLITGIDGFTGKHLEIFLRKTGYTVYGTTFSNTEAPFHLQCDILNKERLKEIVAEICPDYVIHLAAISFVASEDIKRIYETNIIGTTNLMEALGESKITLQKVIVVSSAAVYGNIGSILSEEMCPKPVNHYGNSKLAMEHMVANYFGSLNVIITRPFNYTGPGQNENFLIPKIVSHYKEKKEVISLGNLDTFREYNDIQFLVNSYALLLKSQYKSGVVNIASGQTYSISLILDAMKDITSHEIRVEVDRRFVRKNEIKELKGSPKKLIKLIGKLDVELGIKNTLQKMYLS